MKPSTTIKNRMLKDSERTSQRVLFEYAPTPRLGDEFVAPSFFKVLSEEMEALSAWQRLSLYLYHQEDMPVSEISTILKIEKADTLLYLRQGLEKLQDRMVGAGYSMKLTGLVQSIRSKPKELAPSSLRKKISFLGRG